MSTTPKSLIFLTLAFALSWFVTIGAHALGLLERVPATLILSVMMAGPAIAALVCAIAFEKGRRVDALGFRFGVNWWWLWAWAIPLGLAAIAVGASLLLGGREFVDIGQTAIVAVEAQSPDQAAQMRAVPALGLIIIAASAVLGALINAPILTLTEELGWRGYLHHLWRPAGFWRASLGTGFVWGIWHAPAIYLYGLNYPDHRLLGVGLFVIWCMLLSPIMTLVRDRSGSVWAAGILHGTINAVGSLTLGVLSDASFPWAGIVGIGGFIALALGVACVWALRRNAGD